MASIGAGLSDRSRRGLNAYMAWTGEEEVRIDPARLRAYIDHLEGGRASSSKDLTELVYGLVAALRERDPTGDYVWAERMARAVWAASPARQAALQARANGPGRGGRMRALRVRLVPEEWPRELRDAWAAARRRGDRKATLRELAAGTAAAGPAHGWKPSTATHRERVMGLFLAHLKTEGTALEVTPDAVEGFIEAKRASGVSAATVATYALSIALMSKAMWPNTDWGWLMGYVSELQGLAEDAPRARKKAARMQSVPDLRALGRALMRKADRAGRSRRSAVAYQWGLVILLLTHHPVRRANLHELRIANTIGNARAVIVATPDGGYLMNWPYTKNWHPRADTLADDLVVPMRRWIAEWRPVLESEESDNALWLSGCPGFVGKPVTAGGLSAAIHDITQEAFGVGLGTHIFRDITASAIVDGAPERVGVIPALLGHRDGRSQRPYVELASSVAAAATLEMILERIITKDTAPNEFAERTRRISRLFGRTRRCGPTLPRPPS